jgi:hypothetical protein
VIRRALSNIWSCKCFGSFGYDTVCRLAENRSVGGSIPPLGTIGLSRLVLSLQRPFADPQEPS